MIILKNESSGKRQYYVGFGGSKPSLGAKGSAARMDRGLAATVLRQLEALGFAGYVPVDETDTDKPVTL